MTQDIISTAIVLASAGYTCYNLYAMFFARKKSSGGCSGCSHCKT